MEAISGRAEGIAGAIRWCSASVGWALLVGGLSVVTGLSATSAALVGFGLDSMVDGGASATLVWRFRQEQSATRSSGELEGRAAHVVGALLLLIATYLVARASIALVAGTGPESSALGIVLSASSMFVLPVLGAAKLRLARVLGSQALRADGVLSAAGAGLAAATLLALVLASSLGWWWADSIAALLIAVTLLREGFLTLSTAAPTA